jgi:hypothetical protein
VSCRKLRGRSPELTRTPDYVLFLFLFLISYLLFLRRLPNTPTTPSANTPNVEASGTPVTAYPLNPVTVKLAYNPSYAKSLAANAVQLLPS